jgi:hypothetical protein
MLVLRSLVALVLVWASGCVASGQPRAQVEQPPAAVLEFSVRETTRSEKLVAVVLELSRPHGSDHFLWGGRTFFDVRYFDGKGKLLGTDAEQWVMFNQQDFNQHGSARTETSLELPLGAHSFELELKPNNERTKRVVIPGNRL